jgi:hypothetical protein
MKMDCGKMKINNCFLIASATIGCPTDKPTANQKCAAVCLLDHDGVSVQVVDPPRPQRAMGGSSAPTEAVLLARRSGTGDALGEDSGVKW